MSAGELEMDRSWVETVGRRIEMVSGEEEEVAEELEIFSVREEVFAGE